MIRIALLAAALSAAVLAGCASSAHSPVGEDGVRCDMTVSFGSYGSGVDTVLKERITRTLEGDHRVAQSIERRWGREGESTLCIRTRNRGDIDAVFGDLQAMAAQEGGVRAPTTVARGRANFPAA